ncbi:helix-turn-helix transcriptional regulator [Palleronia caenipelagi]|uniref:AlpA family transcriptional regulator n=1 Tax=Palleronia caenipelagi TaxID=2489174 RepID=A0A547Q7J3_9RHOB|nr:AlpA family transcriptional regulator [Palleronia caenipelagi]TRD22344.1 AlpA family transcriptional regulator [Palleronia caenipelagi]
MSKQATNQAERILRRPEVESQTGLSRSTLYAMIAEGTFPRPVKLGKRAVGWHQSQISDWLNSRVTNIA